MRLFDPDAPVMHALRYLSDLILLNLVYVLCCLPVVTAGAARAALFYACNRLRAGKGGVIRGFFQAFRGNLWPATGVWLLLLALMAIFVLDLVLVGQSSRMYLALSLLGLLLWFLFDAAVFPLCSRFACGFGTLLKNGFYVSLSLLPRTAPIAALHALPVLVWCFAPRLFWAMAPLLLALYEAAVTTLASILYEKPFEAYTI